MPGFQVEKLARPPSISSVRAASVFRVADEFIPIQSLFPHLPMWVFTAALSPGHSTEPVRKRFTTCFAERPQALPDRAVSYLPEQKR